MLTTRIKTDALRTPRGVHAFPANPKNRHARFQERALWRGWVKEFCAGTGVMDSSSISSEPQPRGPFFGHSSVILRADDLLLRRVTSILRPHDVDFKSIHNDNYQVKTWTQVAILMALRIVRDPLASYHHATNVVRSLPIYNTKGCRR